MPHFSYVWDTPFCGGQWEAASAASVIAQRHGSCAAGASSSSHPHLLVDRLLAGQRLGEGQAAKDALQLGLGRIAARWRRGRERQPSHARAQPRRRRRHSRYCLRQIIDLVHAAAEVDDAVEHEACDLDLDCVLAEDLEPREDEERLPQVHA